jgi:hypothetical protein
LIVTIVCGREKYIAPEPGSEASYLAGSWR